MVQAGADPGAIRLKFDGAKALRVDRQGDLELDVPQGTMRFRAPTAYQENQGKRKPLESSYLLGENGKLGFKVKQYDPTKPLVIDPVLDMNTLMPGGPFTAGTEIALDPSGNTYVTGYTGTANNYDGFPAWNYPSLDGTQDAFVAEIDSTGTTVLYTTYLGGSGGTRVVQLRWARWATLTSPAEPIPAIFPPWTPFNRH